MLKNKFIKFSLLGGIFIVIVVIGVLSQVNKKEGANDQGGQTTSDNIQTQNSTSSLKPAFAVDEAGFFETQFYKDSKAINNNGDLSLTKNDKYEIIFFAKSEQFLISILDPSFDEVRSEAEKTFLENFGGDRDKACKLNVIITTPRWVNRTETGKEYPLSFCR